jgi:hypothetical protein
MGLLSLEVQHDPERREGLAESTELLASDSLLILLFAKLFVFY